MIDANRVAVAGSKVRRNGKLAPPPGSARRALPTARGTPAKGKQPRAFAGLELGGFEGPGMAWKPALAGGLGLCVAVVLLLALTAASYGEGTSLGAARGAYLATLGSGPVSRWAEETQAEAAHELVAAPKVAPASEQPPTSGRTEPVSPAEEDFLFNLDESRTGPAIREIAGRPSRASASARRSAVAAAGDASVQARHDPGASRRTVVAMREEEVKVTVPKPAAVTQKPRATFQPRPAYPKEVQGKEIEGSICVRVLISTAGTPRRIDVVESEPKGVFDAAVKETVSQWRFIPARNEAGKTVEYWQKYHFSFKLQRRGS